MTLADRIVVMRGGAIEQVGEPIAVFERPVNTFVAGFIGTPPMNLVPARIKFGPAGLQLELAAVCRVPIPDRPGADLAADREVVMGLRTEDLSIADGNGETPPEWQLEARVEVVEPLGNETNLHLDVGGVRLVGKCEGHRPVRAGQVLRMSLNLRHLHIFDAKTTRSIY